METVLTDIEVRVLGCLIEKEATTPDYYPLTLNSLTAACNQKSNRDPAMHLDEKDVVVAIDALRYTHQLVATVATPGSRAAKYKHNIQNRWAFSLPELAILCELMVRGPQTLGELRTHAERLHKFSGIEEIETVLNGLINRPNEPLAVKLQREAGRKEPRYAHLLGGPVAVQAAGEPPPEPARIQMHADNDRFACMEQDIQLLKADVEGLKAQFAEFRR